MFNISRQNQNLETTQLANTSQNTLNLTVPKIGSSNIYANPNNNPQFSQNFNPQFNPNFNPIINNNPSIKVEVKNDLPKIEVKTKRTISRPVKFGLESKKMNCPFCDEPIQTGTKTSMNMKALLTAIGTFYIGFVIMQACKNKEISCLDCEHSCPNCGNVIGTYYAM